MATVSSVSLITALSDDLKEQFRVKVYFKFERKLRFWQEKK